MKKLLLAMLVLVLAVPSIASAAGPSGTPVLVPEKEGDGAGGPSPKSWLFNDIFFVRSHICRTTGITICGPDPLVSSGASFSGVERIWVPFNDLYSVYFFVTDVEGNVLDFKSGNFNLVGDSYNSFFSTFSPFSDGLYKFVGLVIANGTGKITFANHYHFRVGGPGSGGCCP